MCITVLGLSTYDLTKLYEIVLPRILAYDPKPGDDGVYLIEPTRLPNPGLADLSSIIDLLTTFFT